MLRTAETLFNKPQPSDEDVAAAATKIQPFLIQLEDNTEFLESPRGIVYNGLGVTMLVLGVVSLLALAAAFVFRGRGLMTAFGISTVKADGSEVSRLRALFRSALALWPALLGGVIAFKDSSAPSDLKLAIMLFAAVIMVTGAVAVVRNPTRGPQDRLAGTALIPS